MKQSTKYRFLAPTAYCFFFLSIGFFSMVIKVSGAFGMGEPPQLEHIAFSGATCFLLSFFILLFLALFSRRRKQNYWELGFFVIESLIITYGAIAYFVL